MQGSKIQEWGLLRGGESTLCPCHGPIGILPVSRFVKLCTENKSELFVLWLINDHLTIRLSGMASRDQRHYNCNTWFINNVFSVISRSLLSPKLHHKVKILI